ncbi:bifunctional adenosylcobinamide kinase/adenosylcobinamide-phosphate guanylyltransferase [Undibacterium sp. RuRC25W]|uniref:bifunctional adenosylcobinamide kinase/adenosylcobinamide-phosphate guanylyltransferase n=1 Tax=Undibacterium sp. RuRC25W TaxID=3413047 RepID=UPI003BF0D538
MKHMLVFGGARSGKSRFAERMVQERSAGGKQVVYIATACPSSDPEMQSRILHHQQQRPPHWTTVEQPLSLGSAIETYSRRDTIVIIDCLTVWLSNCLFSGKTDFPDVGTITPPPAFTQERQALLNALASAVGEVMLVSNEVGMGIVPMGAVSRWFVDEAGRLNQDVAAVCESVVWVAAGLPLYLKGQSC